MTELFQLKDGSFAVFSDTTGAISWVGSYKGNAVQQAFPLKGGAECIIMLDPDTSSALVYENLMCINIFGEPVWVAELPSKPDTFVSAELNSEGLLGRTWSGMQVAIDFDDGRELRRIFVK